MNHLLYGLGGLLWERGSPTDPYLRADEKKHIRLYPAQCPYCSKHSPDSLTCQDCRNQGPLKGCLTCFTHNTRIKKLIGQFKYRGARHIGQYLAKRMTPIIQTHSISHNTEHSVLCPIPIHWYKRFFVRGFNQSALLANHLSKQLHIPTVSLVRKIHHHTSQQGLSKSQRYKNVQNTFTINTATTLSTKISRIIIVDDVYTTGATMHEVARILHQEFTACELRGLVISKSG